MTDPISQERREECRQVVREFLAVRVAVAHHPQEIRRRLNEGHVHDFQIEEITAALAFLESAGQARVVTAPLGATKYFQATSAGVLAHERGE